MNKGRMLTTLVAVSALILASAVTPAAARAAWRRWRGAGIAASAPGWRGRPEPMLSVLRDHGRWHLRSNC